MSNAVNILLAKEKDYIGAKLGMWIFLFTEIFLFGGMFLIYAVYRFEYSFDFYNSSEHLNLIMGTLNTALLLTSSLTMALSILAIRKGNKKLSTIFLFITIILGILFMVNKYIEWTAEISNGIYPNSPELLQKSKGEILFYGLYFVMTGLHGLHVLAGIIILSVMLVFVRKDKIRESDFTWLENSGLYWHLVDVIWIFLFPLFYLAR